MGVKLTPWFTVFHRPPEAVATYQTLRLRGSTAISAIRPELKVPARLRSENSRTVSLVRFSWAKETPRAMKKRAARFMDRSKYNAEYHRRSVCVVCRLQAGPTDDTNRSSVVPGYRSMPRESATRT